MFRGHVPTIQASKAHAIVNSAGQEKGPLCGYAHSQSGPFCTCFGPASDVTDGSSAGALTACRAAATARAPRVPELLSQRQQAVAAEYAHCHIWN